MFKKLSTKTLFLIIGVLCAALAVFAVIAVIAWNLSVMFVFAPVIFAIVLISSAFSLDSSGNAKKSNAKKTKKQIAEEEYVSPFFADDSEKTTKGRKRK